MIIIITGTPGSGKTTITRALAKKINGTIIDIKKLVTVNKKLFKIKNHETIVDVKKLKKLVVQEIDKIKTKKIIIVEGHLACEIAIPANYVIILRCNPTILKKRLEKRDYPRKKINENLLAEMLDYSTQVARNNFKGKRIIEIETAHKKEKEIAYRIEKIIKRMMKKGDLINYTKELKKFLGLKHARS